MMKYFILVFVLLIAAVAGGYWYGFNNPNKKEVGPVSTNSVSSESTKSADYSSWLTCSNSANKIKVSYPSGWATLTNGQSDSCQFFDLNSTNLTVAKAKVVLNFSLDQKSFTELKTSVQKSNEEQLLLYSRQIEINGRLVDWVETESTGIGSKIKGAVTTYYFFNTNPLVVLTATENDKSKQTDSSKIFEQIANSLEF